MFKLQGWVEEGNTVVDTGGLSSSNVVQGSFPGATVTVYLHGTVTLATLYSDDNVSPTPLANPFTASAAGTWGFYAETARYDVVFSGGDLDTPFTLSDLTNGAGGGTGNVTGPSGAVDGDVASYDGTSGLIIKDSGRLASTLVDSPVAGIGGHLVVYDSSSGVRIRDAGLGATGLVAGPASATSGNLAVFSGGSGKILADGGSPGSAGFIQASKVNVTGGDFTTTNTNFADVTSATVTISTGAHRCIVTAIVNGNITVSAPNSGFVSLMIDGVATGGTNGNTGATAAATGQGFNLSFTFLTDVLSAGSHTFKLQAKTSGGTLTINSGSGQPLTLAVMETSLTS